MTIAKKRFGQNFLIDPRKAQRLVDSLGISPGDCVLEVGPGNGALTSRILNQEASLTAVELDRDLISGLMERFGDNNWFKLVEDDIIKINPNNLFKDKFKLIGNLPYNISGAMVEWMIRYSDKIHLAVITVQKEVGDRLRAEPENREYGSLTVIARTFYNIRKVFDIPPGCFKPAPKVMSSALELKPDKKVPDDIDMEKYVSFVRACFFKKRKKIVNSLVSATDYEKSKIIELISSFGYNDNLRAEQLSVEEFIDLFYAMKNYE